MEFCRKMLFVWTNKFCSSQCMRLTSLIETEKYTLPKVNLEGFLIYIPSETPYSQSMYI